MAHVCVFGLGYGDESKGSIVDYLCRIMPSSLVVRFNGGPQALHHVVLPDGHYHGFSTFGSGALRGARTLLDHNVCVNPTAVAKEAEMLEYLGIESPTSYLYINGQCPVITPLHANYSRWVAQQTGNGTTGVGVGAVGELQHLGIMTPVVTDLWMPELFETKMKELNEWYANCTGKYWMAINTISTWAADFVVCAKESLDKASIVGEAAIFGLLAADNVVYEGAQGVLLDQDYGFHPYTTWSHTTPKNAIDRFNWLTEQSGEQRSFYKLGVSRTYHTRHGAGPLPTEAAVAERGPLPEKRLEKHNAPNEYMGPFRIGDFELPLLSYAVRASGGVDGMALSHLDHAEEALVCNDYIKKDGSAFGGYIPLPTPGNLASQMALTELLQEVKPSYTGQTVMDYLELNGPGPLSLKLASHGPSYRDKIIVDDKFLLRLREK